MALFLVFLLGADFTTPDYWFSLPTTIRVSPDGGRLYVPDVQEGKVPVFDAATGSLLFEIGRKGLGPGEFQAPSDVAVDPAGLVWVIDGQRGLLQAFDAAGAYQKELTLPFLANRVLALEGGKFLLNSAFTSNAPLSFQFANERTPAAVIIDGDGKVVRELAAYEPSDNPLLDLFLHGGSWIAYRDELTRFTCCSNRFHRFTKKESDGQAVVVKPLWPIEEMTARMKVEEGPDGKKNIQMAIENNEPVFADAAPLPNGDLLVLRYQSKDLAEGELCPTNRLTRINRQGKVLYEWNQDRCAHALAASPSGKHAYLLVEGEEDWLIEHVDLSDQN